MTKKLFYNFQKLLLTFSLLCVNIESSKEKKNNKGGQTTENLTIYPILLKKEVQSNGNINYQKIFKN